MRVNAPLLALLLASIDNTTFDLSIEWNTEIIPVGRLVTISVFRLHGDKAIMEITVKVPHKGNLDG